jgi:hypothetical protein
VTGSAEWAKSSSFAKLRREKEIKSGTGFEAYRFKESESQQTIPVKVNVQYFAFKKR